MDSNLRYLWISQSFKRGKAKGNTFEAQLDHTELHYRMYKGLILSVPILFIIITCATNINDKNIRYETEYLNPSPNKLIVI